MYGLTVGSWNGCANGSGAERKRFRRLLILLNCCLLTAWCVSPLSAQDADEKEEKNEVEAVSPDGQFAFRYGPKKEDEETTYDLIGKKSGKVLKHVAKSQYSLGPSARFGMEVLWRPDSKAFALTATLWKRGSYVALFRKDGGAFHEVKVPELRAEIPAKVKQGKSMPHISEMNSGSAKEWRKDGTLVVEVESVEDGNDGSATALRTVVLGFGKVDECKAKILKSTIKYTVEKP